MNKTPEHKAMKTITFTPDLIVLTKEGEILLLAPDENLIEGQMHAQILASTNPKSTNTKHIERSKFVKPEVDVEQLSINQAWEWTTFDQAAYTFSTGFKAGYNANKKEFTREEMETAMRAAIVTTFSSESAKYANSFVDVYINNLRPLTLPKSVICDEEYCILNVIW